ncbi:UDP-glycosyltransferase 75C1-like [Actinidia eriantha]|uniref:UDP-glycosyltransferase 75C1-like n=1 Tax=Actinidia eriantha TaxID=165200 RepID=UPI0025843B1A|nr:UDP-glycosyltransferase 75C1-like [Actinidia eriantha]
MTKHHFLLLSCPSQGHINPTLELAKKLTSAGALVTLATTVHGLRRLTNLPALDGLSYASFSDGYDDGKRPTDDPDLVMAEFRRVGSQTLTKLLLTLSNEGRQVSFVIYSILLAWAAEVAREMHLPSAFLCSQSATTFALFHKFFNSRDGLYYLGNIDLSISIKLPGLPLLASNDLPTSFLPNSPHKSFNSSIQEHIQTLEQDPNPCILVNTFDALEEDSIKSVDNMNVIAIGPLIPSDNSVRIDLFEQSKENYLRWLDSKPDRSAVYVSFGSMVVLNKRQIEEILQGLVESQRPFLWVIRSTEYEGEVKDMIEAVLKEEDVGLIVPWCSQMEVLSHRSTGCFLTHCGWNSITESLVVGVPVVGCPHWSDQTTNAKLVEEVWGTGVRAVVNEEGVVEREEIRRCLEMVMGGGERGEEMRRNSVKWKGLAVEAVKEGGSSHTNFKQFLERLW